MRKRVVFALLSAAALCGCQPSGANRLRERAECLRLEAVGAAAALPKGSLPDGRYVYFLSVCDGPARARVFRGLGTTPDAAYRNAVDEACGQVGPTGAVRWVKADLVTAVRAVESRELPRILAQVRKFSFEEGFAFSPDLEGAVLAAEVNAAHLVDWKRRGMKSKRLVEFLREAGRPMPKDASGMVLFRTAGWMLDEDGSVHALHREGPLFGLRQVPFTPELIRDQLKSAADYLVRQQKDDGSFVYGFYSGKGREIEGYNILRHAGTAWALACMYAETGNPAYRRTAEKAAKFLADNVVSRDAETSYVREAKNGWLKLGGCGLAVIALETLMDATKTDAYADLCGRLGNGILSMWDGNRKMWIHVFGDTTFREDAEHQHRVVYYDGEATFALCLLYRRTGDRKWLDAVLRSADMFIEKDYVQYRDQWVAYAMNRITQISSEPRYLDFAVRNLQGNLQKIRLNPALAPVCMELLMEGAAVIGRARGTAAETDYLRTRYKPDEFEETVRVRLETMEANWLFPELAMYLDSPEDSVGTFADRGAGFRIRIDDVQHCIGGLLSYVRMKGVGK